jgi:hypothetical protein
MLLTGGALTFKGDLFARALSEERDRPASTVYRAVNGSPAGNLGKVIELMGGMGKIIESQDLVVIKPNVQWWNQGAPNLLSLKTLIDSIMRRPGGFHGQVVVAENCHRGRRPWTEAGWATPFARNGDISGTEHYNHLADGLKKRYGKKVSIVHWIDVDAGGKRVFGPSEGDGYVYCDGTGKVPLLECRNDLADKDFRATIMSYPVFVTAQGTVVDLKNGIWEKGVYTGQPVRFINLAALNHHSAYCGVTSAVKNYLGVADLSGGPDPSEGGRLTGHYFNFHSFPLNKWAPGPRAGMIGRAVGTYLRTIRQADLNIVTAEWVGLSSRTDPPLAHTRAVLASTDPVALDYHASKYLVFPNSKLAIHNPDQPRAPIREYLEQCATEMGGEMDPGRVRVVSYDFQRRGSKTAGDWTIKTRIEWGINPKGLLKYWLLRMGVK